MKQSIYIPLSILAGLLMILALGLAWIYAPVEARMGVVQKIFYFHVPSAYLMYLSWSTCAIAATCCAWTADRRRRSRTSPPA